MQLRWVIILFCIASCQALAQENVTPATEKKHYVSDDLFLYMRAGPGLNYKLRGSITAGEPIYIVDSSDDGEFTKVRDRKQREGWIETKFVTDSISRRFLIEKFETDIQQKQRELSASQNQLNLVSSENNNAIQQIEKLQQEIATLSLDLTNTQKQLKQQEQKALLKWMMIGGLIAGCGVLLGMIITLIVSSRRKKSMWA